MIVLVLVVCVLEVEEFFAKGQKGSSAMPHKRNPIRSERLTGMARLVRSHAGAALENVALWHERDISHSSVERVILPDACILTHFMLVEITDLVKNLLVYPENMTRNLNCYGGVVFSQKVLLDLIEKGMRREERLQAGNVDELKEQSRAPRVCYEQRQG
jgi:adenylosuccinate lyase